MSMTPGEPLHLASGAWELEVQPARGGAVTALRHRGRPVLVSYGPTRADAMGTASFALVPYPNRIAQGRFSAEGRERRLPRNFDHHPHPLHGTGWRSGWAVATTGSDRIELRHRHVADAHWPWPFEAVQRIGLTADAARFELVLTNLAEEPAPMGAGFHPAFAACAATRLRARLATVWTIDSDSLPVAPAPAQQVLPELPGPVPVLRETLVDHCFAQWAQSLDIEHAGTEGELSLTLTASPQLRFLQLYMPPGARFFCAEPMSQMPDALNRRDTDSGATWLAPAQSMQVWMSLAIRGPASRGPAR